MAVSFGKSEILAWLCGALAHVVVARGRDQRSRAKTERFWRENRCGRRAWSVMSKNRYMPR